MGTVLRDPPPRQEFGLGAQKAEERGSGRPGLDVLTSARLRAEQAQDWLLEGDSPAQLIAYTQGWLGHFRHDHWEERGDGGSVSGLVRKRWQGGYGEEEALGRPRWAGQACLGDLTP